MYHTELELLHAYVIYLVRRDANIIPTNQK